MKHNEKKNTIYKEYIEKIRRERKDALILMDLPGNKIRTNNINEPIKLKVNWLCLGKTSKQSLFFFSISNNCWFR